MRDVDKADKFYKCGYQHGAKEFAEQLKNCFPDDDMFTQRKYNKVSICIAINKTLQKFTEK